MSYSITIYEEPCTEYKGFVREILLLNDKSVLINICKEDTNEKGWNFSKAYKSKEEAMQSLTKYINDLETLRRNYSQGEENYYEIVSRLNLDVVNKKVLLPDNGQGYKYH